MKSMCRNSDEINESELLLTLVSWLFCNLWSSKHPWGFVQTMAHYSFDSRRLTSIYNSWACQQHQNIFSVTRTFNYFALLAKTEVELTERLIKLFGKLHLSQYYSHLTFDLLKFCGLQLGEIKFQPPHSPNQHT